MFSTSLFNAELFNFLFYCILLFTLCTLNRITAVAIVQIVNFMCFIFYIPSSILCMCLFVKLSYIVESISFEIGSFWSLHGCSYRLGMGTSDVRVGGWYGVLVLGLSLCMFICVCVLLCFVFLYLSSSTPFPQLWWVRQLYFLLNNTVDEQW